MLKNQATGEFVFVVDSLYCSDSKERHGETVVELLYCSDSKEWHGETKDCLGVYTTFDKAVARAQRECDYKLEFLPYPKNPQNYFESVVTDEAREAGEYYSIYRVELDK